MWLNWLIVAIGSAITVVGLWMTSPYLAAMRERTYWTTGTVVGGEYRVRVSDEHVDRWWTIDVQVGQANGVTTVRVPITTGAADRIARGVLEPFRWSAAVRSTFDLVGDAARERDHYNAQAHRLIGREVCVAVPPRGAPLRPRAIIVDPPARARQALVALLVLGLGVLVTVPSLAVALVLA